MAFCFSQQYCFEEPVISQSKNIKDYQHINIDGFPNSNIPGHPKLPIKPLTILLPPGNHDIHYTIKIETGQKQRCDYKFVDIEPGHTPIIDELLPFRQETIHQDPGIYNSHEPYPSSRLLENGIHYLHGYTILTLQLNPVEYYPLDGEIWLYNTIIFSI